MSKRFYNEDPETIKIIYKPLIEMIQSKYGGGEFFAHKTAEEFLEYYFLNYFKDEGSKPLNYFKNITSVFKFMDEQKTIFEYVGKYKRSKKYRLRADALANQIPPADFGSIVKS